MGRLANTFLLILLAVWAAADEIKVYNSRPSRMLGLLAVSRPGTQVFEAQHEEGNLLPAGLRVKADDARGVLIVYGDPDSIEELRGLVTLLDVKKRDLKLTVDIDAPLEYHHNRSETTVKNNTMWGVSDGPSGISLKVSVRINEDYSITYFLTVEKDRTQRTLQLRTKNGNTLEISLDQLLKTEQDKVGDLVNVTDKKTTVGTFTPTAVTMKIRAAIVEEPRNRN